VLESPDQSTPDTDVLLDALGDERTGAILKATGQPTTVEELSETCDIPLSTTYRQVKRLEAAGVLRETTTVDPDGRCAAQYQRTVEHIEIELLDGDLAVRVVG
jgi:predicted transcriptional regulator